MSKVISAMHLFIAVMRLLYDIQKLTETLCPLKALKELNPLFEDCEVFPDCYVINHEFRQLMKHLDFDIENRSFVRQMTPSGFFQLFVMKRNVPISLSFFYFYLSLLWDYVVLPSQLAFVVTARDASRYRSVLFVRVSYEPARYQLSQA